MSVVKKEDIIRNDDERDSISVETITDKMRENKHRQFEHVIVRLETKAVGTTVIKMNVKEKRVGGR